METSQGYSSHETAQVSADGRLLYGLDKELADKAAAKYDPRLEADVRAWITALTREPLEGTLQEALKSGVVLCALANTLQPGVAGGKCAKPSHMKMPFKQMENISHYLEACTELGVPAHDSFQTVALFEGQDMMSVLTNVQSLGRVAQRIPGFSGPTLGAKLATANEREFTEEQKWAAMNAPSFIGSGSRVQT